MADIVVPASMKAAEMAQRQREQYLAYTHRLSIALPSAQLEKHYNQILDWCSAAERFRCTMLQSQLETDNYVSARLELRIVPEGVAELLELVSGSGEVTSKATSVEDLGDAIVDNQKRLELLKNYRDRLEVLSGKPNNDVDALIKLAGEMAKVQSDLELASGQRQKLLQRVEMDLVTIYFHAHSQRSFLSPIKTAFKEFGSKLSRGVADAVTAVAYLLPWSLLLLITLFIIRAIWRRVRRAGK
ncbi:DUF4349 domain-containing protein [Microbulbifer pacificus]|uniref:DUF4349 domain-containing protein n=1 Tax=Microbulbifer pacificus TaxID=407164 RepID=A0AAU0MWP4_9GAMM|nr:DUF4349 domain-containing protein [Microbulbifer pacificus]WOX05035.1 DUF4349 domain-containing protein [Microbulbifer pacificus]